MEEIGSPGCGLFLCIIHLAYYKSTFDHNYMIAP